MTNHVHLIAVPEREDSLAQAFGRAHAEFALAVNRANRRTGHLWQNRFFSCPMSGSHLFSALRYVELNPVRAGLSVTAWGWPWSSARAHATGADDAFLWSGRPEYLGAWDHREWAEVLAAGSGAGECEAVRRATWKGEPLGPREFVRTLERQTGRRLRVGERGRPPKKPAAEQQGEQGLLFAAGEW
jgi:putative transposase